MKKYETVIGIDVSKRTLDLCISTSSGSESLRIRNEKSDFEKLSQLVNEHTLVCIEHTGVYAFPICEFLASRKIVYTLIPAAQIKKSLGIQRGKNDKADAKAIARYGLLFQEYLTITTIPEKLLLKLKLMYGQRERLVKAKNSIAMPAKECNEFIDTRLMVEINKSADKAISVLKDQIRKLDSKMIELIQSDSGLNEAFELCQSVPGIGPQIAIYLIMTTRSFTSFKNARQYACYSGVAPFEYSSGSSIKGRTRISHLANKKAKSLLSMGAINAVRHYRELKAYFDRKVSEGKNKMAVINAVRNKLISRVFATVERGTPFVQHANY
ncbi:MAG: IS110 family transposase [Ekhidna sp.]|uniref:IS110 family transposase n=1 Tax=Ekhidna sp. TaxID=2608089 RepID=UPI0032ED0734